MSGVIAGLVVSVVVATQCIRAVEHDYGGPLPNGISSFCAVLAIELGMLLPMLYFALVMGAIEIEWPVWYRDEREAPGRPCMKCGYDLRGNESAVCPECGEPFGGWRPKP